MPRPPRPGEPAECRGAGVRHSRTPARPNVTNDAGTVRGDQARVVRLRMIGQILPRLGLAVTHHLMRTGRPARGCPGRRAGGRCRECHSTTLAYAERSTLVPL